MADEAVAPSNASAGDGSGLKGLITPTALLAALANDDMAVPPASVAALASPTPQDEYHQTAMSPADEDALLAKALHEQELAGLAADAAEAADAAAAAEADSAAVAMALHEEEVAAASAAAELRDREAQARRAAEEAASEALVRELQQYESCGEQAGGSAALLSRLQAESDAEVARQMQDEEDQQLPPPAFRSLGAATPWGREAREGARAEARAKAATISQHLFQPSARLSGIADSSAACSTACGPCAAGVAGGSYASVASEWPRTVHASSPAPPISLPLPSSHTAGARVSRRLQLVVDGANVGWAFGSANGWSAFCAQGVLHCVEYWRAKGVTLIPTLTLTLTLTLTPTPTLTRTRTRTRTRTLTLTLTRTLALTLALTLTLTRRGKGVRPEAIAVVLHSKYYYAAPHDEAALAAHQKPNPSLTARLTLVPARARSLHPSHTPSRRRWGGSRRWAYSTGRPRATTTTSSCCSSPRTRRRGSCPTTPTPTTAACAPASGTGSFRTCGLASVKTRPHSPPRRTSGRRLSRTGHAEVISEPCYLILQVP